MKIWAVTKKNNKIQKDKIFEAQSGLDTLIFMACEDFDMGKPLMLKKNRHELEEFRRTVFYAADFIESIAFDTFEVEIIDEDKEKQKNRM